MTTAPSSSPPDETAPDADAPDAAAPDAAAPDTAAPDAAASEAKETQPRLLYGREIVQFAHVDKAGDYFRRMFIDAPSAQSFAATGTLPEGATLYLETWFGADQSTVYVRQKQGSGFVSGSFAPSLPSYELTTTASCDGCHATAQATESTYTLPLLRKALDRGLVQRIACDLTSFNPCDLSVYQGE